MQLVVYWRINVIFSHMHSSSQPDMPSTDTALNPPENIADTSMNNQLDDLPKIAEQTLNHQLSQDDSNMQKNAEKAQVNVSSPPHGGADAENDSNAHHTFDADDAVNTGFQPLYSHPIIAREGWVIIGLAVLAWVILHYILGGFFAYLGALFVLFCVQFFRDPPRRLHARSATAVVSPADGRVVFIGQTINPYTQAEELKISVFMNVFNVHSNRIPVDGVIEKISYMPGAFFNAALDKASMQNERNAIILRMPNQEVITFVQIAGLVARRILCYVQKDERVQRGQRYGFIRFGSRVDVYLPQTYVPQIKLGQKVYATSSILADMDA